MDLRITVFFLSGTSCSLFHRAEGNGALLAGVNLELMYFIMVCWLFLNMKDPERDSIFDLQILPYCRLRGKELCIAGQGGDGVGLVRFKEGYPGFESCVRVQGHLHCLGVGNVTLKIRKEFHFLGVV